MTDYWLLKNRILGEIEVDGYFFDFLLVYYTRRNIISVMFEYLRYTELFLFLILVSDTFIVL